MITNYTISKYPADKMSNMAFAYTEYVQNTVSAYLELIHNLVVFIRSDNFSYAKYKRGNKGKIKGLLRNLQVKLRIHKVALLRAKCYTDKDFKAFQA